MLSSIMQKAVEAGIIDHVAAKHIRTTVCHQVKWLTNKVLHGTYKTHDDDDPTMVCMFNSVLAKRNIQVSMNDIRECDRVKKSISQNLGNLWQRILGNAPGWRDLAIGDVSGCDIMHEEKKIYIEVKNKYNTMNSSSEESTIKKLLRQKEKGYAAYVGIINGKPGAYGGGTQRKTKGGIEWLYGRDLFQVVYGADVMEYVMEEVRNEFAAQLQSPST